ncbi:MAG: 16S rRNA (uracil(1498)-N(3))-methyltransferase [Planctomycetes bacterium]|nr:16S rRNA (uracil(1498)-N(3))-methyltransferase [Planctomycetota bacterium]
MADRYFVNDPITGDHAVLVDAEARHLQKVMRAKPGDEAILFDGSGAEFVARVEAVGRGQVILQIVERREANRELPIEITLAAALPKGERQRWLIEKAVELGVARFVPLVTNRGVAHPSDNALARLARTVIEASKQCGRNRLMHIAAAESIETFLNKSTSAVRIVAHPGGAARVAEQLGRLETTGQACIVVGPEGGLTGAEVETARANHWHSVDLGPRILRVETAAVLLVAMLTAGVGK